MQAIIDFLAMIGEIIVSLIEFLISLIGDLLYVIGLLGQLAPSIPAMLGWLPGPVVSIIVTAVAIVIIYKIMGREG